MQFGVYTNLKQPPFFVESAGSRGGVFLQSLLLGTALFFDASKENKKRQDNTPSLHLLQFKNSLSSE